VIHSALLSSQSIHRTSQARSHNEPYPTDWKEMQLLAASDLELRQEKRALSEIDHQSSGLP